MATLKDIAKLANVNVTTVSKALRSNEGLNADTISLIRQIADQLNYAYTVNSEKKLPLIGVVLPEVTSYYYTNILDSIKERLTEYGYHIIMMVSNFSPERELDCIDILVKSNVSGIICFTENEKISSEFRKAALLTDVKFLLITTADNVDFCDSICIDDHQGAQIAVEHLLDLGHKDIAYIGDTLSFERKRSFLNAFKSKDIFVPGEYVVENNMRFEECGYYGMKKILSLQNRPTAIFAAYDNIAIGAMRAIYEAGLSIPEDFSIVGIDNIKTSCYLFKSLTSVNEPTADLGEIASKLIIEKIDNKRSVLQSIKLKPTLNIRESSAPPSKQ